MAGLCWLHSRLSLCWVGGGAGGNGGSVLASQ